MDEEGHPLSALGEIGQNMATTKNAAATPPCGQAVDAGFKCWKKLSEFPPLPHPPSFSRGAFRSFAPSDYVTWHARWG